MYTKFTAPNYTAAENLAAFLMAECGSVLATWSGKMDKKTQLALFGFYFGKGLIVINGTLEIITHVVRVCFGTDTAVNGSMNFVGRVNDALDYTVLDTQATPTKAYY